MNARYRSSSDSLGSLIVFVMFVVIIIIIAIIEEKKEKKRKKELMDYCKRNNLVYSETANNIPGQARVFSLINSGGHSIRKYSEISGTRGDYSFSIFDYKYETGSGKSRHVYNYTICVLYNNKIQIPQFFVRDENFILDSLGKLFGGQDINFAEDPTFSKKFVLQGKNERLVRQFFDNKVRNVFVKEHTSGLRYEGNLNSFMISAPNKITLNQRINLLTKAMNIYSKIAPTINDEDLV